MLFTFKSHLTRLVSRFVENLPIIIFSLFIFISVYLLFGFTYILIIFPIIIFYKDNYRKFMTIRQLSILIGTQFLMVLFAFFATLNLPLCILLNLIVPFLLVHFQTSQFNPQGYFTSALCFTFLQLRPVTWQGLAIQFIIMAYGMAVLTVILIIYSLHNRKADSFSSARRGLLLLSAVLRQKTDPVCAKDEISADDLFQVLHELCREAYKSRGLFYVVNRGGRIHYRFALLFQRTAHFLSNSSQVKTVSDKCSRVLLTELAQFMELAGNSDFSQDILIDEGNRLLSKTETLEDQPYLFVRDFLQSFLLLLKDIQQSETIRTWKRAYRRPRKKLAHRIKMDRFETRFALRLSLLLTTVFVISMVTKAELVYWLALNAFLLLRPMYEESVFRVKTRFAGTIAGCLLMQPLLFLSQVTPWHIVLASVTIVGLYTVKAGTWQHSLFATSFALSLSTMALSQTFAMELRLIYVITAILLVLVFNRFFFPINIKRQFQSNMNQLFHLHHVFLQLLEKSLTSPPDYGVICNIQIQYHLIHGQILDHLAQIEHDAKYAGFIKTMLRTSWYMNSEAEQMLYLIKNKKLEAQAVEKMENYLKITAVVLNEIQTNLNVKPESISEADEPGSYSRCIKGETQLSSLMEQYSKHISSLYRKTCQFQQ